MAGSACFLPFSFTSFYPLGIISISSGEDLKHVENTDPHFQQDRFRSSGIRKRDREETAGQGTRDLPARCLSSDGKDGPADGEFLHPSDDQSAFCLLSVSESFGILPVVHSHRNVFPGEEESDEDHRRIQAGSDPVRPLHVYQGRLPSDQKSLFCHIHWRCCKAPVEERAMAT